MRNNKIVVVQNRPTQFDVPFYSAAAGKEFEILVFYTEVAPADSTAIDREISIAPQWDHLKALVYPARFERSPYRLWSLIKKIAPDHVILCGWYPRAHAVLALLLRLSGFSIGVRSDNTLENTDLSGLRGWVKRILMGMLLCVYHTWHPVGTLARRYLERLSVCKRPVYFYSYAVDVVWFARLAGEVIADRRSRRAGLGLGEDDFVVVGVMKWTDREDPLTLVDAVMQAAEAVPNIRLVLVGDGPLRPEVEARLSNRPGLAVTPGYAKYSELPAYYAVSDLFVHPAISEPYGVSVQEAMACGLPAVVSDKVGSAVDFIEPGVNGDIFPVGDVAALTDLLVDYAARRDDPSIIESARRKAAEWSYTRIFSEIHRCLNEKR